MQSLTHDAAGILVYNSNANLHFLLAVLSEGKNDFEDFSNQLSLTSEPGESIVDFT